MTIRFRAASAASMALVFGLGMPAAGCGKYSCGTLKRGQGVQGRQPAVPAEGLEEGGRAIRGGRQPRGRLDKRRSSATAYFFLANSYDQLYKPAKEGDAAERRLHPEGHRQLPQGRRREHRSEVEEVGAGVPGRRVRVRQAERSGQGRAGLPADHPDGAERARELHGARQAVRGRRPLRRRRSAAAARPGGRSRTTRPSIRAWRPTTTVRATSRRRSTRSQKAADLEPEQPRGLSPRRAPTTGTRLERISASRPPSRRTTS